MLISANCAAGCRAFGRQHCKQGDSKQPHVRLGHSLPWESESACMFVTNVSDLQTSRLFTFQGYSPGGLSEEVPKNSQWMPFQAYGFLPLQSFTEDTKASDGKKVTYVVFLAGNQMRSKYNKQNCFRFLIILVSSWLLAIYRDGLSWY